MNAIAEHECRARRLLKLLGKPAERRNVDRRRERASALLQIKKMAATRYDSELGWGPVTGCKPIPLVQYGLEVFTAVAHFVARVRPPK